MPATPALDLAAALIRCPSVTPAEGGALALLETGAVGRGVRVPPRGPERHGEPVRAQGGQGGEAKLRLQRAHRRGAAR
jgi:hypothetical protein